MNPSFILIDAVLTTTATGSPTLTKNQVVEVSGIEPLTSCMPCKRSPS